MTHIFKIGEKSTKELIEVFNLKEILSNERTTIYKNDEMRLCVDKTVIRVKIFNEDNTELLENLRMYFYGDEYKLIS